jgi:hypothetical protein
MSILASSSNVAVIAAQREADKDGNLPNDYAREKGYEQTAQRFGLRTP